MAGRTKTTLVQTRTVINFFAADTPAFRHGEERRPPKKEKKKK
jgi:hypothetical protein